MADAADLPALQARLAAMGPASPAPAQAGAAPSASDRDAIAAARRRFIVFRQHFPPPHDPGLSFYGGAPIGPRDMRWPRGGPDERSLSFLMQWDMGALAAAGATGLLPPDGALYLFVNLEWGASLAFRFVHARGGGRDWAPLAEPDDLPALSGATAALRSPLVSPQVPAERQHAPRRLPRWPFAPVGVDYPQPPAGEEGGQDNRFWANGPAMSEALLRAQDPDATPTVEPPALSAFARPFPAFPHDWAAVRVVASVALKRLANVQPRKLERFMPDADEAARAACLARLRQDAADLYAEAAEQPVTAPVAQTRADSLWDRMLPFEPIFWPTFGDVVIDAVNASLGLGSAGAASIPADLIAACAWRHRFDILTIRDEYEHEFKRSRGIDAQPHDLDALYQSAKAAGELKRVRDIWAPPPNRMFGPPSFVQGDVEERLDDWLLLLELSSSSMLGLELGDGVLQFLIRPRDLRAGRFDQVELICTGY